VNAVVQDTFYCRTNIVVPLRNVDFSLIKGYFRLSPRNFPSCRAFGQLRNRMTGDTRREYTLDDEDEQIIERERVVTNPSARTKKSGGAITVEKDHAPLPRPKIHIMSSETFKMQT
jgi:hypothetical protein